MRLYELTKDEVPATLKTLVEQGKVSNFKTPDGKVIDLFYTPDLTPLAQEPQREFTRVNRIPLAHGPVTRPTGRGIYFYDPNGFF